MSRLNFEIITPLAELKKVIPPYSEDLYQRLKDAIERRGVIQPVVVGKPSRKWKSPDRPTGRFMVEGEHRRRVALDLDMELPFVEHEFDSLQDVETSMVELTVIRRILTPTQRTILSGRLARLLGAVEGDFRHKDAFPPGKASLEDVAARMGIPVGTLGATLARSRILEATDTKTRNAVLKGEKVIPKDVLEEAIRDKVVPKKDKLTKKDRQHVTQYLDDKVKEKEQDRKASKELRQKIKSQHFADGVSEILKAHASEAPEKVARKLVLLYHHNVDALRWLQEALDEEIEQLEQGLLNGTRRQIDFPVKKKWGNYREKAS